MKKSKNIFERIRLYRINKKNKKKENNLNNKNDQNNSLTMIGKQSKIQLLFKFFIGFFVSIFEYLVIKSNKKNNMKNNQKIVKENNKIIDNSNNENQVKNMKVNTAANLSETIIVDKNSDNSIKIDNKIFTKEENIITRQSNQLQTVKNKLVFIEDEIIYADNQEELDHAKTKIIEIKNQLQNQKSNNVVLLNNLDTSQQEINVSKNEEYLQTQSIDEKQNNFSIENVKEDTKENIIDINKNNIEKSKNEIISSNKEIDKLVKRCDEDLELVDEKQNYLEIQEKYNEQISLVKQGSKEFKLSKRDLRQIKNNVSSIVERQKYNLDQINKYMNMPNSTQLYFSKIGNFLKSSMKLSLSIIPFFALPNRILGLTTSAILFNNSLKSYRMKFNMNYINQNLKIMVTNFESCLKVGINNSKETLSEIENIKLYLNNVPSEVKDTLDYRKYLVEVYSTEKIVQNQIQALQKMSKNYEDIKIKIKKR